MYIRIINMIWEYVIAVIIRFEWIAAIYNTVYTYQGAIILFADKKLSLILALAQYREIYMVSYIQYSIA